MAARGKALHAEWDSRFAAWEKENPERGRLFARLSSRTLPDGWEAALPVFPADAKGTGTRRTSGKILTALAPVLPELWGGSADLAESNNTTMEGEPSFLPLNRQSEMWPGNPYGRTLHFGIREHGMGAILNGITLSGLTRPYGGTFLQFSDYMRGSVRLAALMEIPVTFVWTHDSIGLGEDGPTHQPVEHLWSLRNIPGLDIVRPADANETAIAWKTILEKTERARRARACPGRTCRPSTAPSSRPADADGARRLRDGRRHRRDPDRDRVRGADRRRGAGTARRRRYLGAGRVDAVRWNGSRQQDASYQEEVLPAAMRARVSVEAGITPPWKVFVGDAGESVGVDHFGASAVRGRALQGVRHHGGGRRGRREGPPSRKAQG